MKKHKLTAAAFGELQKKTNIQIKVLAVNRSEPIEVVTKKLVHNPDLDVVEFCSYKPEDESKLEALI